MGNRYVESVEPRDDMGWVSHINWGLAPPFECGGYWGSWVPLTKMSRRALKSCLAVSIQQKRLLLSSSCLVCSPLKPLRRSHRLSSTYTELLWRYLDNNGKGGGYGPMMKGTTGCFWKMTFWGEDFRQLPFEYSWACQQAEEREGHHHMTWCTSAWLLKICPHFCLLFVDGQNPASSLWGGPSLASKWASSKKIAGQGEKPMGKPGGVLGFSYPLCPLDPGAKNRSQIGLSLRGLGIYPQEVSP